jgi:hypothetical protein
MIQFPDGIQIVNFKNCGIRGDVGGIRLPDGIQDVNFMNCKISGNIGGFTIPPGVKTLNMCCCAELTGTLSCLRSRWVVSV